MPKPSNIELRDKYAMKKLLALERLADLNEAYDKFQSTYQTGSPLELEVMDKGYRQLIAEKQQQISHYNKQIKQFNQAIQEETNAN